MVLVLQCARCAYVQAWASGNQRSSRGRLRNRRTKVESVCSAVTVGEYAVAHWGSAVLHSVNCWRYSLKRGKEGGKSERQQILAYNTLAVSAAWGCVTAVNLCRQCMQKWFCPLAELPIVAVVCRALFSTVQTRQLQLASCPNTTATLSAGTTASIGKVLC